MTTIQIVVRNNDTIIGRSQEYDITSSAADGIQEQATQAVIDILSQDKIWEAEVTG